MQKTCVDEWIRVNYILKRNGREAGGLASFGAGYRQASDPYET